MVLKFSKVYHIWFKKFIDASTVLTLIVKKLLTYETTKEGVIQYNQQKATPHLQPSDYSSSSKLQVDLIKDDAKSC